MFTPQKKGWPGWSPSPAQWRDKSKVTSSLDPTLSGGTREFSPVKGLIASSEDNGGGFLGQSEAGVWKHFREAGALDEGSIEKKDRATLMSHISRLESELYDYQYNMGLLLMERKEWDNKMEKLKAAAQDAEENLRREIAAHLIAISEAETREDSLKKALAVERKCVYDLEKALKEMQAESAELKLLAENKLNEAQNLIAGTTENALQAESKLHAVDALQAELNHKQGIAERKMREIEEQEGILRLERMAFKAQHEAYEKELDRQRQSLVEWEQKLQEGQSRVLEGQKLLNQREESMNQKECALKKMETDLIATKQKIETDLIATKQKIETEQSLLQQSKTASTTKVSDIVAREDTITEKEIAIAKKEQELLLFQEKISSRERLIEQHEEHVRSTEIILSTERERIEALEKASNQREAALLEKQQNLIELQISVEQQKVEVESNKAECEKLLRELESQRQAFAEEQEKLKATKNEREELMNLQKCLKDEIDDYRSKQRTVALEGDALRKEKEKFEKEWDILDEKRECVEKELEKAEVEARRVSEWLRSEETRLKEEKLLLQNQIKEESESLRLEKEAFTRKVEHERTEWFSSLEKEKEDLVRDLEQRRRDLEKSIETQKQEIEKQLQERELKMKTELERGRENITMQTMLAEKKLEEVHLERLELEKMRKEISRQREESEKQWVEIRKDIDELRAQKEKLKEHRESLVKEREDILRKAEKLKELNIQLQTLNSGRPYVDSLSDDENKMPFPNSGANMLQSEHNNVDILLSGKVDDDGRPNETPGRLSWLQKCVSGLFVSPEEMSFRENIKDSEESKASLGSGFGMKETHTVCDGEGQLEYDPVSRSSASFTPSSRTAKQKSQKRKSQTVKRTHSISAAMADAQKLLEPHLQCEEVFKGTQSNDKYGEELQQCAQSAIEEDKDTVSCRLSRKRAFSLTNDTVSETETGEMEAESEMTTGSKRKQRYGTPGMKRYNLRRSTISQAGGANTTDDVKEK